MSREITSIIFEEKDFMLTPHARTYGLQEGGQEIFIVARCLKGEYDRNLVKIEGDQSAVVSPRYPEGQYAIYIHMDHEKSTDIQPVISMEILNQTTGEIVDEPVELHSNSFALSFFNAVEDNKPQTPEEYKALEKEFDMLYLHKMFGDRIDGGYAFWERMQEATSAAFLPVNAAMIRAQQGLPEKNYRLMVTEVSPEEL